MPPVSRLISVGLLVLFAAAPAQAAPRWAGGVLSCGPPGAPLAEGPIAMVPPTPRRLPGARCVPTTTPVAVARDGTAVLPATFSPDGPADLCGVRVLANGRGPRYRRESAACLARPGDHRQVLARARDGFAIYGPRRARRLDRCHGHTHVVAGRRVYHYHWTRRAPFTVGCFRGRPARWSWGLTPVVTPTPLLLPPPAQSPPPDAPQPEPPPGEEQGPAGGWPDVTTDPGLDPPFDPAIHDYVVRCDPSVPVTVDVAAPAGTTVTVDGGAPAAGTFSREVPLGESQATTINVASRAATGDFHVRCLPAWFPDATIERFAPGRSPLTIATPMSLAGVDLGVVVSDEHATPIWWKHGNFIDAKGLPGGLLAWSLWPHANFAAGSYDDVKLDGTVAASWDAGDDVGADDHDMQLLPGGDRLLLAYRTREHVDLSAYGYPNDATVVDGEVRRVAPDGSLVWRWSTADHVALEEAARWKATWPTPQGSETLYDIVHINSVEPVGDDILVSLRHTDALYRVDGATGDVEWKLGGTDTPERLDVVGDSAHAADATFGGQHDARVLPDGTVTVHDNRTAQDDPVPRVARFAIDPAAGTATLIDEVTDPGRAPSSFCCGSGRRLADGWLVSWGGASTYGEYDDDGAPRWRVTLPSGDLSYRVVPLDPAEFSLSALRAGMDVMHPRP